MRPVAIIGTPSPRAVQRLSATLEAAGVTLDEWALIVRADRGARGPRIEPDVAAEWLTTAAAGAAWRPEA